MEHKMNVYMLIILLSALSFAEPRVEKMPVYQGEFKDVDSLAWDLKLANDASFDYKNEYGEFKGGSSTPSILSRKVSHLPDGEYKITVDFQFRENTSEVKFFTVNSSGDSSFFWPQASEQFQTAEINNVQVQNGALSYGVIYKGKSTDAFCNFDNIEIQRTNRINSSRYPEYMGVTPYSDTNHVFLGIDSLTRYPSFATLAKEGGANTLRLNYGPNDSLEYFSKARHAKNLGMKIICSIFPTTAHPSYEASLVNIEKEFYSLMKELIDSNLVPNIILIGNEVNNNNSELTQYVSWNYSSNLPYTQRMAQTLSAAAKGLRSAGFSGDVGTHIDRAWVEFFGEVMNYGYKDMQVAAFSCYPRWGDLNNTVEEKFKLMNKAATDYNLKVLIVETAAPYVSKGQWETQDFNIETVAELSPAGQAHHLRKVIDLTLEIPNSKGIGVVTWGSDVTYGIHPWADVTWNRAQVTANFVALPSLYVFQEYRDPKDIPVEVRFIDKKQASPIFQLNQFSKRISFGMEMESVRLYGASGKVLRSYSNVQNINLTTLNQGVYFLTTTNKIGVKSTVTLTLH